MSRFDETLTLLRSRDFALLWLTLLSSGLAQWLRIFAIGLWLIEYSGSALMLSWMGAIQLVVQIPALLWGGTLADHVDRKRLMMLAHGTTALVLGALALLHVADALTPAVVYSGIAITAATQVFAAPARSALLGVVVPERQLMRATSFDTATANVAAIGGPLLFALLAEGAGLGVVFALAALLSSVAALAPLAIAAAARARHEGTEADAGGSTVQRTVAGLRYVARHPILPGFFLLDTGITVVSFYREVLPALALALFATGDWGTGVLGAANSAGAVAGAALALLFARWRAKGMLVLYASLAYACFLFAFGFATQLWVGALCIALLGMADSLTVTVRVSTVMLTTPDALRGRAMALFGLAAYTANNLGTIWIGFWLDAIGARDTLLLGGVLAFGATLLVGALWKPIRAYRSP